MNRKLAKVEFDIGIDSVRGILMGDDPYYIRRYPDKDGKIMHILSQNALKTAAAAAKTALADPT